MTYFILTHRNEGVFSNPNELFTPPEIRSVNGRLDLDLTVQQITVTNELFAYNTRGFCAQSCSVPAPSIYIKPGDELRITLTNNLDDLPGTVMDDDGSTRLEYANRTNIFIHGLDLDPSQNNAFRFASGGGDSIYYHYRVPLNTPPGVHW